MSEAKRQKTAHDAPDNESLKADSTSTTPATMAKKLCIGGNWKCNGTKSKVASLVKMLNEAGKFPENVDVVIAPTALHTGYLVENLRKDINVSVQNVWREAEAGAWTGELTVDLVKDFGVNWTILGHSERRAYNKESADEVAKKVSIALDAGMYVIACVGESLEDRESGKTMEVCQAQLEPIMKAVPKGALDRLVIAYEPVWAIGTGKSATPEIAQETHKALRGWLDGSIGTSEAMALRIIYGGSVKAKNCEELIVQPDIDGFLVGGASLKEEFVTIINSASLKSKM